MRAQRTAAIDALEPEGLFQEGEEAQLDLALYLIAREGVVFDPFIGTVLCQELAEHQYE